jgi:molecular chaperone DnaK
VSFDIDANGIVSVSAKDMATKKEQSITVSEAGTLSENEIDRMVKEAKENEAEDEHRFKVVESRNKLDALMFQSAKLVEDNKGSLDEELLSQVNQNIDDAKEALDSDDVDIINSAFSALEASMHSMSSALYSATDSEEDIAAEDVNENDDNVVDAEYEEAQP